MQPHTVCNKMAWFHDLVKYTVTLRLSAITSDGVVYVLKEHTDTDCQYDGVVHVLMGYTAKDCQYDGVVHVLMEYT